MRVLDRLSGKPRTDQVASEDNVFSTPPESLVLAGAALAGGLLARRSLIATWRRARGENPPVNPAARDVTWTDALMWAAAVGAAVGVARVISRRSTTAAIRRWRD